MRSSCFCKKLECAVYQARFFTRAGEDDIDHTVDILDVHEADPESGPSPHVHGAALDIVGNAQLYTGVAGSGKTQAVRAMK